MLITVSDIPITGRHYDVEIEEIDLDMTFLEPVHFAGDLYKSGEDVRLHGRLKAILEVECDRCLHPFELEIISEMELFYRPKSSLNGEEISLEELGMLHYEDNTIDLGEAVRDTIIIEMPMKLLCCEECKGLCFKCGKDLNLGSCGCETKEEEYNPFKEFFKKNQKLTHAKNIDR